MSTTADMGVARLRATAWLLERDHTVFENVIRSYARLIDFAVRSPVGEIVLVAVKLPEAPNLTGTQFRLGVCALIVDVDSNSVRWGE